MRSNLKALLTAALAIGAINAALISEARAADGEIHIDVGPRANLSAQSTLAVLKIGTWKVECSLATFEATIENVQQDQTQLTTKEATATAEFAGCEIEIAQKKVPAQIKMNGCKYTIRGTAALTAQVQIVGCTTGKSIEVVVPACTITVGEQNELGHVVLTNENPNAGQGMETATKDFIANATVTGIVYGRDGVSCPFGGAELSVTTTVRAYKDLGAGSQDKIGDHQFTTLAYGAQVGLFAT